MKKKIFYMLLNITLFGGSQLVAQWQTSGNNLTGAGLLGSTLNHPQPILFITNGVQYGTLTSSGKWGFGNAAPNTRVHINSDVTGLNPLRVDVSGVPKLWISASSGGTTIGDNTTAPTDGLYVKGNVGIGISSPTYKLDVCGTIRAKELRVATGWCDYVFDKDYKLKSIEELEMFVNTNKHLPGIATASEVENNGLKVGEMNKAMMEKIEELTLYVIQLSKENKQLQKQIDLLKK